MVGTRKTALLICTLILLNCYFSGCSIELSESPIKGLSTLSTTAEETETTEIITQNETSTEIITFETTSTQPTTKVAITTKAPVVTNPSTTSPVISQTVYITDTGTKYHREGCRFLEKSKIPVSLSKAKEMGYTACSVCDPPN